jgi:hypothetical protein
MPKSKTKSAPSLLAEPIEQVVTPWLLVVMLVMTAVFVVLQYVSV